MGYEGRGRPYDFPTGDYGTNCQFQNLTLTSISPATIYVQPTGQTGVVRSIGILDFVAVASLGDMQFNVYYDGATSPQVSTPLASLFALDNAVDIVGTTIWDAAFFSIVSPARTAGAIAGDLRFPIPYTNGICITLAPTNGTHAVYLSASADYPLRACSNYNYRFLVERTTGTVTAPLSQGTKKARVVGLVGTMTTGVCDSSYAGKSLNDQGAGKVGDDLYITQFIDTTHFAVSSRDQRFIQTGNGGAGTSFTFYLANHHQWLNRAAGKKGAVVAAYLAYQPSDLDATASLEGNPRVFANGDIVPTYEWTGTEDFFGGENYWANARPQMRHYGITCLHGTSGAVTAYRQFEDDPIIYQNGCTATWPILAAEGGTNTLQWTAVVYEQQ